MRRSNPAGPPVHSGPAGVLLLILLLAAAACAARPVPPSVMRPPTAEAATWAPTWTAAPSATSGPTATWVSLPSPLPTHTGSALSKATVRRIDVAEALALVEAGEAVLVDVRPRPSYVALHALEAISMPLDEVADCLTQLPAGRLVIFYCA